MVGKEYKGSPIWQGGKPHGAQYVGTSNKKTFGAVGCVVTSIAHALRVLGVKAGAMPLEVQEAGLKSGNCWGHETAMVAIQNLIDAQRGLTCVDEKRVSGRFNNTVGEIRDLIKETITAGGCCLVWVDYDQESGGDIDGEHWVCAHQFDDEFLYFIDSATAKIEKISLKTMSGKVMWRTQRKYKVAGAIAILVQD